MTSEVANRFPTRAAARQRNRAALLKAAAELIQERGYGRTSVDLVAERAGLTKGAVYSIFGSKQALFTALLQPEFQSYGLGQLAELGTPVREVLAAVGRFWARHVDEPGVRGTVLMSFEITLDTIDDPETNQLVAESARSVFRVIADELEQYAAAAGEQLPRPAHEIAIALMGSMNGLGLVHVLGVTPVSEAVFVAAAVGVLAS